MAFDTAQDEDAIAAEAELGGLSAMSGDLNLAELSTDPSGLLQKVYQQQISAQEAQERGDAARFTAARERIAAQNRGPSQSEMLFALSRAMLSPTRYRGFAGFADNMVNAASGISSKAEEARRAREAALASLEDSYATKQGGYGVARAKTAADLVKTAAPLLKPKAKSTTSPVTVGPDMKVRSRATGVELKEPPIDAIYALRSYVENPNNTPENKVIAKQNFDKKFGYGSSDIYGEGE